MMGHIEFSGNWDLPSPNNVSKKKAQDAAEACTSIKALLRMGGQSKAVIVAGLHATATDPKQHLTVRLYNATGKHYKSCHVYPNNNSCNCSEV